MSASVTRGPFPFLAFLAGFLPFPFLHCFCGPALAFRLIPSFFAVSPNYHAGLRTTMTDHPHHDAYKTAKESFVSQQTGGSVWTINSVSLTALVSQLSAFTAWPPELVSAADWAPRLRCSVDDLCAMGCSPESSFALRERGTGHLGSRPQPGAPVPSSKGPDGLAARVLHLDSTPRSR